MPKKPSISYKTIKNNTKLGDFIKDKTKEISKFTLNLIMKWTKRKS